MVLFKEKKKLLLERATTKTKHFTSKSEEKMPWSYSKSADYWISSTFLNAVREVLRLTEMFSEFGLAVLGIRKLIEYYLNQTDRAVPCKRF